MKIAFVGKGGSGKTTLSSLFIRHLAFARVPVIAVDADIEVSSAGTWATRTADRGSGSRLNGPSPGWSTWRSRSAPTRWTS